MLFHLGLYLLVPSGARLFVLLLGCVYCRGGLQDKLIGSLGTAAVTVLTGGYAALGIARPSEVTPLLLGLVPPLSHTPPQSGSAPASSRRQLWRGPGGHQP